MVKVDLEVEVHMVMSLQEAIDLINDLGNLPLSAKSTPHFDALDAQIRRAQGIGL